MGNLRRKLQNIVTEFLFLSLLWRVNDVTDGLGDPLMVNRYNCLFKVSYINTTKRFKCAQI